MNKSSIIIPSRKDVLEHVKYYTSKEIITLGKPKFPTMNMNKKEFEKINKGENNERINR